MIWLQIIYIGTGIITLLAVSVYTICLGVHFICDQIERIQGSRMNWYIVKTLNELALAFHENKKMEYTFKRLAEDKIWGRGMDVWKFRDEVEEKFGREPKP